VLGTVLDEADVTREVDIEARRVTMHCGDMTDERAVRDNADEIKTKTKAKATKGGLNKKQLATSRSGSTRSAPG